MIQKVVFTIVKVFLSLEKGKRRYDKFISDKHNFDYSNNRDWRPDDPPILTFILSSPIPTKMFEPPHARGLRLPSSPVKCYPPPYHFQSPLFSR